MHSAQAERNQCSIWIPLHWRASPQGACHCCLWSIASTCLGYSLALSLAQLPNDPTMISDSFWPFSASLNSYKLNATYSLFSPNLVIACSLKLVLSWCICVLFRIVSGSQPAYAGSLSSNTAVLLQPACRFTQKCWRRLDLLGSYPTWSGKLLQTFRGNVMPPPSRSRCQRTASTVRHGITRQKLEPSE
jgi:hypothetical protein